MTDEHQQRTSLVLALDSPSDDNAVRELARRIDAARSDGHDALVIELDTSASIGNQTLGQLCSLLQGVSGEGTAVTVSGADPRVRWVLGLCEIHVLGPDPDADRRLVVQAETVTGGPGYGWRVRLAEWRRARTGDESEARRSSTAG